MFLTASLRPRAVAITIQIRDVRNVLRSYIESLCEDLGERGGWRKYGEFNKDTHDFEFIPASFLEPRSQRLALQTDIVHSQMFRSLIAHFKAREESRI